MKLITGPAIKAISILTLAFLNLSATDARYQLIDWGRCLAVVKALSRAIRYESAVGLPGLSNSNKTPIWFCYH